MSWQRNYVVLRSGDRVRYALTERPEAGTSSWYVRFKEPGGKRVLRSTGQAKKPQAIDVAHRFILEAYQPTVPTVEQVGWDFAEERLRETLMADGKRPTTVKGYIETLDKLKAMFPLATGPASITDKIAGDFKTKYATGKFKRKRIVKTGEKADEYARRTKSLDSRIRTLKAVFTWFKKLHLVESNPFESVSQPELDKHEVKFVRESDVSHFFDWLEDHYPGWRFPMLFFTVKAVTACRLEDICSLRSSQLQDGRVVFAADATKNRSERYAVLPEDIYRELCAYKGSTWVWEKYPPELKAAIRKKGNPCHRLNLEFSERRLYYWVVALMQEYQKRTGKDLSSHDFRKAAFTRAAEEDIHPKRAAVAFDVTSETMMKYYTATEKKQTSDAVLSGLAGKLLPKKRKK